MRDLQNVSLQLSHVVVTVVIAFGAREWSGDGLNLDPLLALSTLCTELRSVLQYRYRGMCTDTQQHNTQGMGLGGNSINLQAFSTADDMCCHLFTNGGARCYLTCSQYLTCSTLPCTGLHIFSKNQFHPDGLCVCRLGRTRHKSVANLHFSGTKGQWQTVSPLQSYINNNPGALFYLTTHILSIMKHAWKNCHSYKLYRPAVLMKLCCVCSVDSLMQQSNKNSSP
jgi:hypothetical protein